MLGSEASALVFSEVHDDLSLSAANAPDTLERQARELALAAARVVALFRLEPEPSGRAKAELSRARHLLDMLGAELSLQRDDGRAGMLVADDGTWFETSAGRVDVARRGAVRRILRGLAALRLERPSAAMTVDELFEMGWPNERIPYESQVRRVYTAIWTLRTLGLEGVLLTRDEGYLLDPKQTLSLLA